ncbi:MAG: hypothetical protein ACLR8L_16135 [Oscillospiraceae bacterium]
MACSGTTSSNTRHTPADPHPPICASQIVRIIQDMPWIEQADRGSAYADIPPESYPPMIDQHFQTRYRRCDYNINHFFQRAHSGIALFMKRATKEEFYDRHIHKRS